MISVKRLHGNPWGLEVGKERVDWFKGLWSPLKALTGRALWSHFWGSSWWGANSHMKIISVCTTPQFCAIPAPLCAFGEEQLAVHRHLMVTALLWRVFCGHICFWAWGCCKSSLCLSALLLSLLQLQHKLCSHYPYGRAGLGALSWNSCLCDAVLGSVSVCSVDTSCGLWQWLGYCVQ